jgi:predicted nucleic acid-binding protein
MELADTSAWTNRVRDPAARGSFEALVAEREIATCPIVEMELLWTAIDPPDFADMRHDLSDLPQIPIDDWVWARAMDVLQALGRRGPLHHRQVKIPDLVIAAAAERAGIPVVHYDRDFDVIAEVTGQPMRAIAPIGSL